MTRIYKKRPFSLPNSMRVNTATHNCDRLDHDRKILMNIREKIAKGSMSPELYDFINMDGSMERLLPGMPRPSSDIACESLQSIQLEMIDSVIEGIGASLKKGIGDIFDAFKEWILDWWDVNRNMLIRLKKMRALYTNNPSVYGTAEDFEKITMLTYHNPYWEEMVQASNNINRLLLTIPAERTDVWIKTNFNLLNRYFNPFGRYITTSGPRITQTVPPHDESMVMLGSARWRFQLLGQYLDKAIGVLGDEIGYRRLFGTMEHLFAHSTEDDIAILRFAKKLVMEAKSSSFMVAKCINKIMRTAELRARQSRNGERI